MQTIARLKELKIEIARLRDSGGKIAMVPTMGALHEGHMTLVREAKNFAEHVVVSIFVNPKQFGPNEDLAAYPRPMAADSELLEAEGIAVLWAPDVAEMYPKGFATNISVSGVSDGLDGAARPGHFDGVATVVTKLFNQVMPDIALFGEKDYQQLAVIRTFVRDLDMNVQIIGVPTVRDADGLALSSRNAYLDADQRSAAAALPKAMIDGISALKLGGNIDATLAVIAHDLANAGFHTVDYVALCDAASLAPMSALDRPARLLVAARIGTTRLIDNMSVEPVN